MAESTRFLYNLVSGETGLLCFVSHYYSSYNPNINWDCELKLISIYIAILHLSDKIVSSCYLLAEWSEGKIIEWLWFM